MSKRIVPEFRRVYIDKQIRYQIQIRNIEYECDSLIDAVIIWIRCYIKQPSIWNA